MYNQVDTGSSAERAPCLVRTLCKLLRKVSLHALLQGAGKTTAAAAGGGGGSGAQMDTPEVCMINVRNGRRKEHEFWVVEK